MDDMSEYQDVLVQLARLGLAGRPQDVQAYLRRVIRRLGPEDVQLASSLGTLLAASPSRSNPMRDAGAGLLPIDADSRLSLLRHEYPVALTETPILSTVLRNRLEYVIEERRHLGELASQGLSATRTLLFVGPPGVGKTLCARWLAERLDRPLLILDLSTVMSSYLGKTGANLRSVLDYAKSIDSILLLDEFDAIAKKRDDEGEVGELKRLVTVLLQEIDDWPDTSLMVAATNHGEMLDPASWRRFDDILHFEMPGEDLRINAICRAFGDDSGKVESWTPVLARVWDGQSFSDIVRTVRRIRRQATVQRRSINDTLLEALENELKQATFSVKREAARKLHESDVSDRKIHEITGLSRDTLRKMWRMAGDTRPTSNSDNI
ncbi:AAA family ATPase [Skermanella pratensis]|uniref:AAA family ATPase n=1 Tax=Skermanella pratensis TaxID=2233999 RepID=UPI001301375A|nr:ATP-binding protein [Skermanella pratensis]